MFVRKDVDSLELFVILWRPPSGLAIEAGVGASYFTRILRISFLAPDVVKTVPTVVHFGYGPMNLKVIWEMSDETHWGGPRT